MTAFVIFSNNNEENAYLYELENGETVFERQVRVLENCGIRRLCIVGMSLKQGNSVCSNRKKGTEINFVENAADICKTLEDYPGDSLFIGSDAVFSSSIIKQMITSETPNLTLISKEPFMAGNPLKAKVDMKIITDISSVDNGVGWFPHVPVYKLESGVAKEFANALQINMNMQEAIRIVAKDTLLHHMECTDIKLYADVVSPETFENVKKQVSLSDKSTQHIIKGEGSYLEVIKIIDESEAKKPFVIYDSRLCPIVLGYAIGKHDVVKYPVSGSASYDVINECISIVANESCDMIISIGSNEIIDAAKLIKAFSALDGNESYFMQRLRYSNIKHIAVSATVATDAELSNTATVLFEDGKSVTLSHCVLLPDYAVIDASLFNYFEDDVTFGQRQAARSSVRKPKRRQVSLKARIINIAKNLLKLVPPFNNLMSFFFKRVLFHFYALKRGVDNRTIVLESHAGLYYNCIPKALYEKMLDDEKYSGFNFIWAFNNVGKYSYLKSNANTKIVKRNSRTYIQACATSKYLITNTGLPFYIKPSSKRLLIYTWHGKPLKRIGCDVGDSFTDGRSTKNEKSRIFIKNGVRATHLFSPSPAFNEAFTSAYNLRKSGNTKAILETGHPKNDFLFKFTPEDVVKIKMSIGVPLHKKVILYAPTWRPYLHEGGAHYTHTNTIDWEQLYRQLGSEYVILYRTHHLESVNFPDLRGFVYDVTKDEDVSALYVISDILISDYSGTIFDFANLRRPMVFYMHDLEQYANDANGLYFDVDILPGKIVYKENEIAPAIKEQLATFTYDEKYKKFNEMFNCLDGPDCAGRTLQKIIDLDAPADPVVEKRKEQRALIRRAINVLNIKIPGFFRGCGFYFSENSKKLASYKNKYKGQRCFLVGNGPSLTMADLEMLKGEISFGCNLIYKIFDSVEWRPDFICLSEPLLAKTISRELCELNIPIFTTLKAYELMREKPPLAIYAVALPDRRYKVRGNMMAYYVSSISTVMSYMIELAVYMGFSEIFLLGVDGTHGSLKTGHFIDNYRDDNLTRLETKKVRMNTVTKDYVDEYAHLMQSRSTIAYTKLKKYAEKANCKIYNATRGGTLEIFERINFDEIFLNKES